MERAPHSSDSPRETLTADLTGPQRQAVLHTEGPLLIVAAAGSGKTRVITRRIAHLLSCGVPAWQILAVTFTNKAAGEMRERVDHLLHEHGLAGAQGLRGLTITTFHALCARLLRRYAAEAGLKPDFTIYDASDQASLCKKVIENLQLSTSNFPARSVLSAISNAKNRLEGPEAFAAGAHDFSARTIAKIYASYAKALRAANAVDFDDLLLLTAQMLRTSDGVRQECQDRWRYLMIDEYQDTNKAQFIIASLIAGQGRGDAGPNICVVGDPDQSIYAWRGADISNILDFEEHYPKATVITLGENFRSTSPILETADTLIRRNMKRRHKDLFTSRKGGDRPEAILSRDERHEAHVVTDWLRARREGDARTPGEPWREMAVFYRTNALSRVIEEALRNAAIPYSIARGTAFYEREEVKTALAYLRLVANGSDDVSLSRVVNTPARGLGDTTMGRIESAAAAWGVSVLDAMRRTPELDGLTARAVGAARKFVEMIDSFTGHGTFFSGETERGESLAQLVSRVIRESGLEAMYKSQAAASRSETDLERLDNLGELVSSAREFELQFDPDSDPASFVGVDAAQQGTLAGVPPLLAMLRAYLERVALVADADSIDPSQGSVTLMTLHAAKGLEFNAVAIVGLEEGLLPHSRAFESEVDLEEERRLAFVGITRARRRLLLTCAKYRTIRGSSDRTIPSRFLSEVNTGIVRFSDQSDTFADLSHTRWGDGDDDAPPTPRPASRSSSSSSSASGGSSASSADHFPPGSLVRHPQFGVGKVISVTGGTTARATIEFKGVGTKTLILEYARLTRVSS